ncbi:serine protease 7-like [Musca vetustissima]|uniref:serine protease 7-like n=1 Tax=Musca vetustissima TaxID=27455 RepID=UPI002AB77A91|nr:serine protease 7-like [Musca vetustissima]
MINHSAIDTSSDDDCASNNRRCENPNGRIGTCVAIHNCQVLMNSDPEFVEASACGGGFGKTPYVCCSSDTGFVQLSPKTAVVEDVFQSDFFGYNPTTERSKLWPVSSSLSSSSDSILPEPPTCGGEFIDNRIYGGNDANAYEFPWMAFLEYSNTDPFKESVCAGSLITSRYVITAAHCVTGPILLQKGALIGVRLGVLDYTKNSIFGEDNRSWRIEKKIIHENYRQQKTPVHDVALLRLDSNVRYSQTIRPICLPSVMPAYNLKTDTKLTVAGWGATETKTSSPIKQKVAVSLADQKFCRQQYGKFGLSIEPTHLCAGGTVQYQDSCRGDSGAPLMHYRNGAWVLEGIVSFGRRCGLQDWPGVYVRVALYTDWIKKKLRK